MRIGEVATEAGVHVDTVRYYERRGLLDEPSRRNSGYRDYPQDAVRVIRFVRRAKELGFTLTEIEGLLALRTVKGGRRREVRALAAAKVRSIDERIARLTAVKDALGSLLDACECGRTGLTCSILEALDDSGTPFGEAATQRERRRQDEPAARH